MIKPLATLLMIFSLSATAQPYEADYRDDWCEGEAEVALKDGTRVDCLTDDYAVEVDYAYKWAESIGQSLYYANMTGKAPAVLLIVAPGDSRFVGRFHNAADGLGIKLFLIDKQ